MMSDSDTKKAGSAVDYDAIRVGDKYLCVLPTRTVRVVVIQRPMSEKIQDHLVFIQAVASDKGADQMCLDRQEAAQYLRPWSDSF